MISCEVGIGIPQGKKIGMNYLRTNNIIILYMICFIRVALECIILINVNIRYICTQYIHIIYTKQGNQR